jgi:hypothetical protein
MFSIMDNVFPAKTLSIKFSEKISYMPKAGLRHLTRHLGAYRHNICSNCLKRHYGEKMNLKQLEKQVKKLELVQLTYHPYLVSLVHIRQGNLTGAAHEEMEVKKKLRTLPPGHLVKHSG